VLARPQDDVFVAEVCPGAEAGGTAEGVDRADEDIGSGGGRGGGGGGPGGKCKWPIPGGGGGPVGG